MIMAYFLMKVGEFCDSIKAKPQQIFSAIDAIDAREFRL
ncbi:hypothetical protein F3D3_3189 [Fusibacter sp. 3D3]|nr:hypothetical protein F3D3_3189 [Fusibacter sp. 3D3]